MDRTAQLELLFTDEHPVKHIPIKRLIDLSLSALFLFILSPLFALVYLLVKINSPGPVIFNHQRIGRRGTPFSCYKFRTMYQDSEKKLEDLLQSNPAVREEWLKSHKLKKDPRVTPLGRFLRASSIDELPQLWNVMRGDLSLVGPRPVTKVELEDHYRSKAYRILSVRPGITGLWQVSGRNNTSYPYRIQLDEYYVANQSTLLDIKILLRTIPAILFRRGAY